MAECEQSTGSGAGENAVNLCKGTGEPGLAVAEVRQGVGSETIAFWGGDRLGKGLQHRGLLETAMFS